MITHTCSSQTARPWLREGDRPRPSPPAPPPICSQPSAVEQILDRQYFTLEDLLDEEDIIQECRSQGGRLGEL